MTDQISIESVNEYKSEFWLNNFGILFDKMDEFYPSHEMTLIEKLNS